MSTNVYALDTNIYIVTNVFFLQIYALLVAFSGFLVFEIRKNLDLRKILVPQNQNLSQMEFPYSTLYLCR